MSNRFGLVGTFNGVPYLDLKSAITTTKSVTGTSAHIIAAIPDNIQPIMSHILYTRPSTRCPRRDIIRCATSTYVKMSRPAIKVSHLLDGDTLECLGVALGFDTDVIRRHMIRATHQDPPTPDIILGTHPIQSVTEKIPIYPDALVIGCTELNVQRAKFDEERAKFNEERAKLDKKRAKLDKKRAKLDKERAEFNEDRAEFLEERAECVARKAEQEKYRVLERARQRALHSQRADDTKRIDEEAERVGGEEEAKRFAEKKSKADKAERLRRRIAAEDAEPNDAIRWEAKRRRWAETSMPLDERLAETLQSINRDREAATLPGMTFLESCFARHAPEYQ